MTQQRDMIRVPHLLLGALLAAFIAYSFLPEDSTERAGSTLSMLPDSTELPPLIPDVDELQSDTTAAIAIDTARDIVTGPFGGTSAGLTVGERLKRLDSLMLVVPADSLAVLMERYEELLDSALMIQTDAPPRTYAAENRETTPRSNQSSGRIASRPSTEANGSKDEMPSSSSSSDAATTVSITPVETPASTAPDRVEESPVAQLDQRETTTRSEPTRPVRPSDAAVIQRRSNSGYVRSTPHSQRRSNDNWTARNDSETRTTERSGARTETTTRSRRSNHGSEAIASSSPRTTSAATRERPSSRKETASRSERATRSSTTPRATRKGTARSRSRARTSERVRSSTSSLKRKYTEGLARFRAGDYRRAIEKLTSVASSSQPYRHSARYFLAVAQERTGRTDAALKNYERLKGRGGRIGAKSWMAYARMLAKSGRTSQAKKELNRLAKSSGAGRYAAEARKMLESL